MKFFPAILINEIGVQKVSRGIPGKQYLQYGGGRMGRENKTYSDDRLKNP